ncbi:MAG: CHASE2 domain-containing protein [Cyanobacteria bacterium J06641_5]
MSRNSDLRPGYRTPIAIVLAIALSVLGSRWLGVLQPLEWAAFDFLSRQSPPKPEPRICLLEMTDRDIQAYGYPLSTTLLAEVLEKLTLQETIVGLKWSHDLLATTSDPEFLQGVIVEAENPIGIAFEKTGDGSRPQTIYPSAAAAVVDRDGVRRRAILFSSDRQAAAEPSLSLMVAYRYLDAYHHLYPEPGRTAAELRLGRAYFKGLTPQAGGYVRTNTEGLQILLNWRVRAFERFSLGEVLAGDLALCPIVFFETKIANIAAGFYTPHSGLGVAAAPVKIPAHEYDAIITAHLLSAALEGERAIGYWPEPLESLWITFWIGSTAGVIWQLRYRSGFAGWAALVGVGALATIALATYGAFAVGIWLPLVSCWLGSMVAAIATVLAAYIGQLRELVRVRTVELQHNQELALLGKLMAGVSHDVRNPTQYILNFVEVCLRRLEDIPSDRRSRWQARLEGIATSAKTIEQVVQGLLATSQEPRPIAIIPNQTLTTICDLVAHGKAIKIDKDLDPELNQEIALACGINTIVFNLLNNAVDAVAARPQPSVSLRSRDCGNHLELQVWDNGEGIPAELLQEQRLFAAFATTKPWGTGLGLFTVRELLDRCGGTIAVESDSHSWTQFTVRLPKRERKTPAVLPE